jgi:hypothetical protein
MYCMLIGGLELEAADRTHCLKAAPHSTSFITCLLHKLCTSLDTITVPPDRQYAAVS